MDTHSAPSASPARAWARCRRKGAPAELIARGREARSGDKTAISTLQIFFGGKNSQLTTHLIKKIIN